MEIKKDILEEDWDDLDGWDNWDEDGCVSEIDPAGQLYLDATTPVGTGGAARYQDIGSIADGYYVEIKFKGDTWGGAANAWGITLGVVSGSGEDNFFRVRIANDPIGSDDGLYIWDNNNAWVKVVAKTWDDNWHTVVFYIHNSRSDCDIWIDKSPNETPDVTDADCAAGSAGNDGDVFIYGYGNAGIPKPGEYHIDHLYIGTAMTLSVTDLGSGADATPAITGIIPVVDVGAGVDVMAAISAAIPVTDLGSGAEVLAITNFLPVSDVGAGSESLTLESLIEIQDSGVGADVASKIDLAIAFFGLAKPKVVSYPIAKKVAYQIAKGVSYPSAKSKYL